MLRTHALHRLHVGPVDLCVEGGTCVSLSGASGAGKSALLRAIADLDPHEGDVTLDGLACTTVPAPTWRRMVTYVASDAGWWAPRVGDHFREPSAHLPLSALGLAADALSWPVSRLSTGERQRLSLLRALQPGTRVLLLDEPTSGLDPRAVAGVEALLRDRLAAGLSILWVTHDCAQAARIAQRHLMLAAGQLQEVAP